MPFFRGTRQLKEFQLLGFALSDEGNISFCVKINVQIELSQYNILITSLDFIVRTRVPLTIYILIVSKITQITRKLMNLNITDIWTLSWYIEGYLLF